MLVDSYQLHLLQYFYYFFLFCIFQKYKILILYHVKNDLNYFLNYWVMYRNLHNILFVLSF